MLSRVKPLYAVKLQFPHFNKFYCSDKLKLLQEISLTKDMKAKLLEESPKITVESYEECAKFEEKILKQVLIEKERDATLRSRLSKECKTLFTRPADGSTAGPYALQVDQISLKTEIDCQDWSTYPFNHLQNKMLEKSSKEVLNTGQAPTDVLLGVQLPSVINEKGDVSKGSGGSEVSGGGVSSTIANRPVRQNPGKVLFCFIPEEWWRFFIPKTGVTGFGTFLFTFATYLVSKEIYVLEHYYYHGLGALFLWIGIIKFCGPLLAEKLDKEVDQFEKSWNEGRVQEKEMLEDSTVHQLFLQRQIEGQLLLLDAKRENVKLQLEEEFRNRQLLVYKVVKQRLDYHVALELVKQRMQQKNLVDYVTREVKKAITPDMEKTLIYYSIDRIVDELNQDKK